MNLFDLRNYARVYPDFLQEDYCNSVVKSLQKCEWKPHVYTSYGENPVTHEDDLEICSDYEFDEAEALNDHLHLAVTRYIKDLGDLPWFTSFKGHSCVRFNRYNVGTRMRVHCDHIRGIFDGEIRGIPILTILGGLNNDYEGGDLILWESEKIELKAGQILIFPSNFMYPHRIDPVTVGTRYSYVSWVF